jgi:hypothetical protein
MDVAKQHILLDKHKILAEGLPQSGSVLLQLVVVKGIVHEVAASVAANQLSLSQNTQMLRDRRLRDS